MVLLDLLAEVVGQECDGFPRLLAGAGCVTKGEELFRRIVPIVLDENLRLVGDAAARLQNSRFRFVSLCIGSDPLTLCLVHAFAEEQDRIVGPSVPKAAGSITTTFRSHNSSHLRGGRPRSAVAAKLAFGGTLFGDRIYPKIR
jgi:hypothetical protein